MPLDRIVMGPRLNEYTALQAAADFAQVEFERDQQLEIDFTATTHYEPFGMLFIGSAIRRLQHRARSSGADVDVKAGVVQGGGFPGHMGFWNSMGLQLGRPPGSAPNNENYLPITRLDVAQMYRDAGGDPRGAGLVESEAARLARILANPMSPALLEALTYSLRELIRNVIEHATAPEIWIAGQSWPKRGYVQVAILDEGRGIRASLADNPESRFPTDAQALVEALKPGVTRNKGRVRSAAEIERWAEEQHRLPLGIFDNTGYGLYMISTFCREAGQFMIASGNAYHGFIASAELSGATLFRGTAIRMVIEPSKVGSAFERLFESVSEKGLAVKPLLSASKLRELGFGGLTDNDE